MDKVRLQRLGNLLNFKRGYDLPGKQRRNGLYPVISSSGISGHHDGYKADGEGIITGRYGTLGEVYYINGRYWPHNTTLYVTDFKGNHPKYIYYLLRALGKIRPSDKSAVPGINRNELHEIKIPLIDDIIEQEKIAAILSVLDTKIDCNNRINAKLEAMARTLYDYWFVQFEFPDENKRPYKSSGGKMVYNEVLKQEIPEGWKSSNILALSKLLGGGTPTKKKQENWGGDISFFTPSDIDGNIFKFDTVDKITGQGLKNSSTRLLEENTIFITARGSVGEVALAGVDMAMNQSCYAICAKQGVSYAYLFFLVKELIHHLKIKSSGSVFNSIVIKDIELSVLAIPNLEMIKKFQKITEMVFQKIKKNTMENNKLANLRDWLLPMLMNGQATVKY